MTMQGGGSGGNGDSANWRNEVKLKIQDEAKGVFHSIPPYFRRFDAFGNDNYPSIFMPRRHKTNNVASTAPHQIPCSSNPTSTTPQPLPELSAGREPIQLQDTRSPATDREVVVVALGPYHYHSAVAPPLIARAKKCGIVTFLAGPRFGLDPAGFLGWALEKEALARGFYERDSFQLRPDEMAEMLLLDGCLLLFTVFLLSTSVCEDSRPSELARDKEHGREFIYLSADISLHMKQTRLDLLMLHNQIPFFVLEELHGRLQTTLFHNINCSIHELVLSCFDDIHPSGLSSCRNGGSTAEGNNPSSPPKFHHLLHLFHWSRVPRDKYEVGIPSILPKETEPHIPSATDLEESRTCFRQTKRGRYSLDIVFGSEMLGMRGVMSIPPLCIHNYSECVFRSLIQFEQNHLRCGLGVTAYCICMAQLLQGEADAKVLRKRGILVHTQKTDKEIVDFFRGLKDEYSDTLMPDHLLKICKDVAAHQHSRAGRAAKWIGRQCFPKQTVTFFVIFGAVISVATLINTIHSMYRYYHPFKGLGPFYNP